MKRVLLFVYVLVIGFCTNALSQETEWLTTIKKIRPLEHNREIVRKTFGEPYRVQQDTDYFNLKDGRLIVSYSYGNCSEADLYGPWKVEKDKVIELHFVLENSIKFSPEIFSTKGFKYIAPDDTPQLKIYTNKKTGVEYEVQFRNMLSDAYVRPTKRQENLKCKTN